MATALAAASSISNPLNQLQMAVRCVKSGIPPGLIQVKLDALKCEEVREARRQFEIQMGSRFAYTVELLRLRGVRTHRIQGTAFGVREDTNTTCPKIASRARGLRARAGVTNRQRPRRRFLFGIFTSPGVARANLFRVVLPRSRKSPRYICGYSSFFPCNLQSSAGGIFSVLLA